MTSLEAHDHALPTESRVVVVGAGYAGLATALRLHDAGIDVVVLEASDRVGGRIWSREHDAAGVLDLGGQWVGPTQTRLLAWAERFDCARFPTFDTGDHVEMWVDGSIRRFRDAGPADGPGFKEYVDAVARIEELAATVNKEHPWATPNATALDSETVESYLLRTVPCANARCRLALSVQGVLSTEPRDLSVLHLLFYIASAGGYAQLMETQGCAQEQRFLSGAQAPASAVAALLAPAVHFDTPVVAVEQTGAGYLVDTPRGAVVATQVVIATPPPATTRIRLTPPLPVARNRWVARSVMGDVAKLHVVYRRPFWRERGMSGQAVLYSQDHVGVVFDNSPQNAAVGVLACFIYGDRLRAWSSLDATARRSSVLTTLVTLFGPGADRMEDYVEVDWTRDPLAGGGYAAVPAPGTWVEHGAAGWRTSVEGLHFAGAETASVWNGYMDGAISSGERAAAEVVKRLGG